MKLLKIFSKEKKKRFSDIYQQNLNKNGKEQFLKLMQKGLQVPIVLL